MMPEDGPGPAVDRGGNPVIDPTKNVLDLVQAAMRRQDDLREMSTAHLKEVSDIQAAHIADMANLRAEYGRMLRDQESARIDAIRAVDVGAVSRAAEVSATQASTLAAQVAQSAETLRGQVQAAATASTIALAAALEPIQKSIDDLRRVQYEQQGQRAAQTETKGTNQWVIGLVVSLFFLFLSLAGFIGFVLTH